MSGLHQSNLDRYATEKPGEGNGRTIAADYDRRFFLATCRKTGGHRPPLQWSEPLTQDTMYVIVRIGRPSPLTATAAANPGRIANSLVHSRVFVPNATTSKSADPRSTTPMTSTSFNGIDKPAPIVLRTASLIVQRRKNPFDLTGWGRVASQSFSFSVKNRSAISMCARSGRIFSTSAPQFALVTAIK